MMPAGSPRLSPLHFVVAIGLGVVGLSFQALTYAQVPVHAWQRLVDYAALPAVLAACVGLDRARRPRGSWALLVLGYALLAFAVARHPQSRDLVIALVMAHCLVLAVFVADRAVASGSPGRLAYGIATVAGCAAGAAAWATVLRFRPDLFAGDPAWVAEAASPYFAVLHPVHVALLWLMFGGAAVLLYGERQLATRTLERLREAELERLARSREVIESQLQAAQARVEPQFLFDTLAHVRRSCCRDPAFAERMLDELVSFLRAAVPRVRDTSSALGQEAALAQAYLGVLRMHPGSRLDFAIELDARAARAKLPSMLLLPLVGHAVMRQRARDSGAITLRIVGEVEKGRLIVRVANDLARTTAAAEPDAIALVRERLGALYGARASLSIGQAPEMGMQVVVDIPYEPAL